MSNRDKYWLGLNSLEVRIYPELAQFQSDVDRGRAHRLASSKVGMTKVWLLLAVVLSLGSVYYVYCYLFGYSQFDMLYRFLFQVGGLSVMELQGRSGV